MTDRTRETPDLLDTPIMPTGSGVADLEVARELDSLEEGAPIGADADVETPTDATPATIESSAHPS